MMAKIQFVCPGCGRVLQCDERDRGHKIKCPHCKYHLLIPKLLRPAGSRQPRGARIRTLLLAGIAVLAVAVVVAVISIAFPMQLHWPDRRPIGILFLASNYHASATNPRGWFNDPGQNFTGPDGPQRFRQALFDYTDQSLAILKRINAQGVIVWDVEGEQFPHKITYIGDPRLVGTLAPEMAPVVDEFFARLTNAGLRVGVTIRPQQFVFGDHAQSPQQDVVNLKRILLEKIDYARAHWGATIFYVDSNGGIRRPDEAWQMRRLAAQRPDVLLIPEHSDPLYRAFSAPYVSLRQSVPGTNAGFAQTFFPRSFQALDISDAADRLTAIEAARARGDVLLCRAWYWNPECQLLENFAQAQTNH
jgi:DNA-directed RNA polymerase subunit RPC12/RpoP